MKLFNRHTQRRATILLCMFLLAVMVFSSVFIILEHEHDCSGADCPICCLIHQAQDNLTCLGLGENSVGKIDIIPAQNVRERASFIIQRAVPLTLILLKVRQNK